MPGWGFEWGDEWGGLVDAQGSVANAKEDTVFLALNGVLATDQSQYEENLTAVTGGGYETNSDRAALVGAREVYVRCVLTHAESNKVLVYHGAADVSDQTFAILAGSTGRIELWQGGSELWDGPTIEASDYSIGWSTRPNPDTTGAGDAMISEIIIYDHDVDEIVALEQFSHEAPTLNYLWSFSVGGVWDGGALIVKPTNAPTRVRVSSSFHNAVEFFEDWVSVRTPFATALDELIEPVGAGAETGVVGEWAGQANVGFAATHARELRGRMLSPLINEVYLTPREYTSDPDPSQWVMPPPGAPDYSMDVTKLRFLTVDGISHARVRVQVSADGDPDVAGTIAIRCYAMNRPHLGAGVQLGGKPIPPLEFEFVEAQLTVTTTGVWLELGTLRLPTITAIIEGWTRSCTLGLAYSLDEADDWVEVHAWQVLPIVGEP